MSFTGPEEARMARRILRTVLSLWRPRPLTREEKRAAGLKYCRHPGYGYRWYRGRRVPDPHEAAVMAEIVELRRQGCSWYRIAAALLRQGVVTREGREWSPARCRRAYQAAVRQPPAG
jgi:hypothetical protein